MYIYKNGGIELSVGKWRQWAWAVRNTHTTCTLVANS